MLSLCDKYKKNKNLLLIPLLILILVLYFVPTSIRLPYSHGDIHSNSSVSGDFIGITKITSEWFIIPVIAVLFLIFALVFLALSYKNLMFVIGTAIMPIWHIVYISLIAVSYSRDKMIPFRGEEKAYISFSMILAFCVLIYSVILFFAPLLKKHTLHNKPTKSERIAELEKQVAELQSKLPNEND